MSSPGESILSDKDVLYLHIGLQYGSPFRPTFTALENEDVPLPDEPLSPDYLLLKEVGVYMTAFRAADLLHQGHKWTALMYRLEDNMRPIGTMVPGVVSMRKTDAEEVRVWPPLRAPRRHVRRRPRAAAALEDGDDGNSDDDGDDEESVQLEDDVDVQEMVDAAEAAVHALLDQGLVAEEAQAADTQAPPPPPPFVDPEPAGGLPIVWANPASSF